VLGGIVGVQYAKARHEMMKCCSNQEGQHTGQ
jgi:hypothetical protein